jgi:hypothetical protein
MLFKQTALHANQIGSSRRGKTEIMKVMKVASNAKKPRQCRV